jgi:hypothetical protein
MIGTKKNYQDLFFQTEQTVNRKKSGFRAAPVFGVFFSAASSKKNTENSAAVTS